MYKIQIFCPDEPKVINKIIDAASRAGAGVMGNYSQCAFIVRGNGQWKPEPGAHPAIGKVGGLSQEKEVKIEMHCPDNKTKNAYAAIKKAHPYEEPAIEFIKLTEILL